MKRKFKFKITKYFKLSFRHNIKNKLLLLMLIVTLCPILIITSISYLNSKMNLENEVINQNISTIQWIGNYMNNQIEDVRNSFIIFFADKDLIKSIQDIDLGENSRENRAQIYIISKLKAYIFSNHKKFNSMGLHIEDIDRFFYVSYDDNMIVMEKTKLVDEKIYEALEHNSYQIIFDIDSIVIKDLIQFTDRNNKKGFYVVHRVNCFEDQKYFYTAVLNVKWEMLSSGFDLLNAETGSKIFILDNKSRVFYNPYGVEIECDLEELTSLISRSKDKYIKTSKYYVFYEKFSDQAYIIKMLPLETVNKGVKATLKIQLIIMVITLFSVIWLSVVVSYKFTEPIKKLAEQINKTELYLTKDCEEIDIVKSQNDEIKVLEQSYSYMIKNIKEHINKEYKYKAEVQTAQLRALQAQINPHFMYNTLQMIGGMAIKKGANEIYCVINDFSSLMRYNMKFEKGLVSLYDEIDIIKSYLEIQKRRFGMKLEVCYDIDESLYDVKIPKLTLQPIIENCFKYGFDELGKNWNIKIMIFKDSEQVCVVISDNGEGMSRNDIEKYSKRFIKAQENVMSSYDELGLINIDARLKLNFGLDYGLILETNEVKGFKIKFMLPIE